MKLFISDLDGTLLNQFHRSDKWSQAALEKILQAGDQFALATGRHLHDNHRVGLGIIDLPVYKIAMNGALIKDPQDVLLDEQPLDAGLVRQLLAQFPKISFELITKEGVYLTKSRKDHLKLSLAHGASLKMWVKFLLTLRAKDYHFQEKPDLSSVLMIGARVGEPQEAQGLVDFLNQKADLATNYGPNLNHFEIIKAGVNKATAALYLTQHLGLKPDQVQVFGNDLNDVPLLEAFEASFAPENAVPAAKQAAKHQLASNRVNGVAKYLLDLYQDQ